MTILAIESSCDDTAAAIWHNGELRSHISAAQDVHHDLGGVVPELASRDHQRRIVPVVTQALAESGTDLHDVDAVAATYGPGLSGSLLVGLSFAKALAMSLNCPFVGVNHLEGHLYSAFIKEPVPPFPHLCLIVSGGHTQLVHVKDHLEYELLGTTRDDAAGEAFDKAARLFNLPYPGGPEIDQRAQTGDAEYHRFPRSRPGTYDFSFSGLKTSLLYYLNDFPKSERTEELEKHLDDLCASFQEAIVDVLIGVISDAVEDTRIRHIAITGGVSANSRLRERADQLAEEQQLTMYLPDMRFCMDNAAMIAAAAQQKLSQGLASPLTLEAEPQLAW